MSSKKQGKQKQTPLLLGFPDVPIEDDNDAYVTKLGGLPVSTALSFCFDQVNAQAKKKKKKNYSRIGFLLKQDPPEKYVTVNFVKGPCILYSKAMYLCLRQSFIVYYMCGLVIAEPA
jgi:hypothetical protein